MTHPEPVAVVTGANRGIGLEVCRQLAARGYAVVLGSRDLRKGRRAASADLAVVREAMETNLFGAWRTTLALLPLLRRSGRGRIVNVSSEGGSLAGMGAGTPAYHVTKAALNALTRTLAAELRSAPLGFSSTPSVPAGRRPTWAARPGVRSPTAPPRSCGG